MSDTKQSDARRLDELMRRGLSATRATDDVLATRVLERLGSAPLPSQRRSLLSGWWPTALLDMDLLPAWPRIAALAGAGALGIAIGLFGADVSAFEQRASPGAGETDVAALVFGSEPVTGVGP
jgi:hypothetical protein